MILQNFFKRVSLPKVREGTRVGQKIDAKILNLPSKGDRSNTCVRSEGCCGVSELVNYTIFIFHSERPIRSVMLKLCFNLS